MPSKFNFDSNIPVNCTCGGEDLAHFLEEGRKVKDPSWICSSASLAA